MIKQSWKPWTEAVLVTSLVLPLGFISIADEMSGPLAKLSPPYTISAHVGLVVQPVLVTDKLGRPVAGLRQSDFQAYEDSQPSLRSLSSTNFRLTVQKVGGPKRYCFVQSGV